MSEIKGNISGSLGMQSISSALFIFIFLVFSLLFFRLVSDFCFFGFSTTNKSETKREPIPKTLLASQLNLTNAADHTHALRFSLRLWLGLGLGLGLGYLSWLTDWHKIIKALPADMSSCMTSTSTSLPRSTREATKEVTKNCCLHSTPSQSWDDLRGSAVKTRKGCGVRVM